MKNLEQKLSDYIHDNFDSVVEKFKEVTKIQSVISVDTNFNKDDGKRYVFFGNGCAFVWIDFDKRNKTAAQAYELGRQIRYNVGTHLLNEKLGSELVSKFNKLGSSTGAIFQQDVDMQIAYFNLVRQFMIDECKCKRAYINYRLD